MNLVGTILEFEGRKFLVASYLEKLVLVLPYEEFLNPHTSFLATSNITINQEENQIFVMQITEFLHGNRTEFSFDFMLTGAEFQKEVLSKLLLVPYGKTISYANLAKEINRPKAVRAVANAVSSNLLLFVVPCHRVIGSNNSLTGFRAGLSLKKTLLEMENPDFSK